MAGAFRALVSLAFVLVVAVALICYSALEDRSLPQASTRVIVPVGATARDVGKLLQAQGVTRFAIAFDLLARYRGQSASVKAGEFDIPAHSSVGDVLREVTGVGRQVATWVTVPEGYTAREVARALADRDVGPYDAFVHYFLSTPFAFSGERLPGYEGYLFPDTYLVPEHASPQDVAKMMTDKFLSVLPSDSAAQAKRLGVTVPQAVVLASIVEREAKADDERALMAGVYYNRLRAHMPLQVDATIEYTFVHHKGVITYADLATDSPYNTYKYAGLPPTPIANPGRPSLLAAFHPKKSDFYYYVYMGNGHSAFARTLAEHQANVARYLH